MITDLASYDVDPVRGFLPAQDPLTQLPAPFAEWDRLAAELPALILTGRVRRRLEQLQTPDLAYLEDSGQLERAMLVISALGMAYVWGMEPPARRIPAAIAVPWQRLADKLGRPPIMTHASIVLNNWRRLDPQQPIMADNLASVQHFLGGMDEQWFFTVTAALEAAGAPALLPLVRAKQAVTVANSGTIIDDGTIIDELKRVASIFQQVLLVLRRMYEKCDPYIFYLRIRPFLTGWDKSGIVYEGVSETPLKLNGGSAAQSSLIQAFDAGLGIEHLHPETRPFLTLMRDYMPPRHRRFVEDLAAGPSVYDYVSTQQQETPALANAFNACIDALDNIRKAHMEIVVRYILHQSPQGEKGALGTGGTSFVPLLKEARKETIQKKLKQYFPRSVGS